MSDVFDLAAMKCGSGVSEECANLTVSLDVTGFQLLTADLISSFNFLATSFAQSAGSGMTFNQQRALNSARCAVFNLGDNAWTWLAGTYYLAKQFNKADDIVAYIDEYYPYICTCKQETDQFSELMGSNDEVATVMSACSEKSQREAV